VSSRGILYFGLLVLMMAASVGSGGGEAGKIGQGMARGADLILLDGDIWTGESEAGGSPAC